MTTHGKVAAVLRIDIEQLVDDSRLSWSVVRRRAGISMRQMEWLRWVRPNRDRLQPMVVSTRRGADQLMRVLEVLARLELNEGLDLAQLLAETDSRLPRDATVGVLVSAVRTETAITLGQLRRRGFAVTAFVNVYSEEDFADASGLLLSEGIESHHLKDEDHIPAACRTQALR